MRIAIAISVLFGLPCCSTQAAFTDFSDYPHYQLFEIGEIFESQGLVFKAVEFQSNGTHVAIGNSLSVGPGVEFLLPAGVQEVSLAYIDGAGANIAINGVQPVFPVRVSRFFSLVDSTTLAGVSIETTLITQLSGLEEGILTLRGPINSLVIAGIELSIDNVTVRVPEPATAALFLVAGMALFAMRRHR